MLDVDLFVILTAWYNLYGDRALQPPGWLKEWHCGVRVIKSGKLVGFISAVPAHIKIYDQ